MIDQKFIDMEFSSKSADKQEFATLSDIMHRFQQVPYEQFQQELNDWFKYSFFEKHPELKPSARTDIEGDFAEKIIRIGNEIFKQGEDF